MILGFFDIDGVLCTNRNLKQDADDEGQQFDSVCKKNINKLIRITDMKIVISSSWRLGRTIKQFNKLWKGRGMLGEIIDFTPKFEYQTGVVQKDGYKSLHSVPRGEEIDYWLKQKGFYYPIKDWNAPAWDKARNKCPYTNYIILDDDKDMLYHQKNNFIVTTWAEGFTKKHLDKALKILKL